MAEMRPPSFRAIRAAILAAPPRPAGFPLDALRDRGRLAALRAAPHLAPLRADLRAEAARALHTPPAPLSFGLFRSFAASGDRAAFETAYFDRRRQLAALALTAALDETDAPIPALADLIWQTCDEYAWALPAHLPTDVADARAGRLPPEQVVDLFAAHTAHALAEALALLGARLDPWLHHRVRAEVERRIFQPLFHDPRHLKWEWEPINWAAVCGGCAGLAALALEDDRERLAGMVERVAGALECFLEGFGADGGCAEGLGYWTYGVGFYTYFADALGRFTGGALDLLDSAHIRRIAAFPQAVSLGGGAAVNYSDAEPHARIHAGLGSYLAARFGLAVPALAAPALAHDHAARWGHISRDLLWSDAAALQAPASDGACYLPDLAWVVERRRVGGDLLAFSARGGHNDEPHNHNDLGHFILHLGGESLLADLGAGRYTRQYFGAERYQAVHTSSLGHSVPLINGHPQGAGRAHAAEVLRHAQRPDGVDFALDLTRAYADPALQSFTRSFAWSVAPHARAAALRLTDTFRFAGPPAALEERFVSLRRPALAQGRATWRGARGAVALRFDDGQFDPAVEVIETETHHGEPLTVYVLRLRLLALAPHVTAAFELVCELSPP